jgi:hypothetical protein
MFTEATNASTVEITTFLVQGQGGGLQPVSCWARKMNTVELGNT